MDKRKSAYEDYKNGLKVREIAEKYGVTVSAVKNWKRRYWQTEKDSKDSTVLQHSQGDSWVLIETEYVTDISRKPCSLKDLADKYDMPYTTIRDYSTKNNWAAKRKNFKQNTCIKTAEKTTALLSDNISDATARHFELSDKLLDAIEQALQDEMQFYKYVEVLRQGKENRFIMTVLDALNDKKLLTITTALEKLQKMQRETLGILSAFEQHKVDYDNKRLEYDNKRLTGDKDSDNIAKQWIDAVTIYIPDNGRNDDVAGDK